MKFGLLSYLLGKNCRYTPKYLYSLKHKGIIF
uniref:Uncharacterized protein n=1 Tax=Anguilla anguilla TaxID=7936 RepID=A0A0E9QQY7_ANGAN